MKTAFTIVAIILIITVFGLSLIWPVAPITCLLITTFVVIGCYMLIESVKNEQEGK